MNLARTLIVSIVILALGSAAAVSRDAYDQKMDVIALSFFAASCNFRLNSERAAWIEGIKLASPPADVKKARAFAKRQTKEWDAKGERAETCRRFHGMLTDMNWL